MLRIIPGRRLHTKLLGSGLHTRSAKHIAVIGPVGMNPSLHWTVTLAPTTLLVIGPTILLDGAVGGEHAAEMDHIYMYTMS